MSRKTLLGVLIVGLAALLMTCTKGSVAPPAAMVGHWEGKAEVAVNWCNATELIVSLTINGDGTVTGKVGDAGLKDGHIYPNPGKPPKGFTLQTNFVVEADLDGPLVAAEGITRDTICIPVEVNKNGQLGGAFLTSGNEYGGKDEKVFSAGLKPLTRTPAP
jgi:hypothetical protein